MAYIELAYYYDSFMRHAPYDKWVQFTKQVIDSYEKDIQSITDLGCGTGEITLRLSELNYSLTGIDYSPHMLAVADQKAFNRGQSVFWQQQDMRELTGLSQQDMIISYCDVMNYIRCEKELKNIFQRIYDSLSPEGLFIFDVHDLDFINEERIGHTFADLDEDFTYVWFCDQGEEAGEMIHDITFFVENSEGTYSRYHEIHRQRTFPLNRYEELLRESGFKQVDLYNDFELIKTSKDMLAERRFFVVMK